jgi:hypothetical protein
MLPSDDDDLEGAAGTLTDEAEQATSEAHALA